MWRQGYGIVMRAMFACAALPACATAQARGGPQLGSVEFRVSCSAGVQDEFSTGVAYLHSFQYSQAGKTFEDVSKRDPKCAMGYWGSAMSLYYQIWNFPSAAALKKGHDYAQQAEKLGGKTEREREYIAAAAAFYQASSGLSEIQRTKRYSAAMAKAFADNPGDVNAGAFYALSLVALAQEGVDDAANRKHAIAILQKLFAAHSDNPGVDHYLIHAADTPQLAPEALEAARKYAILAPDSAHALHMPSHIFTRLGYWQESIKSNLASAAAAEKATRSGTDKEASYQLHALSYLEYAYLQRGENKKALAVIAQIPGVPGDNALDLSEYQALSRITYVMETHDWKTAPEISLPPKDEYPSDKQSLFWMRTIAAARMSDAAGAQRNLAEMEKIFAAVPKAKWKKEYLTPSYLQEAEAWADFAEGKAELAVQTMRQAAAQESRESDDLTIPGKEMLGDLLLALHEPALAAYEGSLKDNPNRFDSLYGAAQAAETEKLSAKARAYLESLVKSCASDADRRELGEASQMLAER